MSVCHGVQSVATEFAPYTEVGHYLSLIFLIIYRSVDLSNYLQVCLSRCCPNKKIGTPSRSCVSSRHQDRDKPGLFGSPGFRSDSFGLLSKKTNIPVNLTSEYT